MLDKKVWPNLIYALILFVLCATLWQIAAYPKKITKVAYYVYTSNMSFYTYPVHTLPSGDYHQLINLTNFVFTILNVPCRNSTPLLLILIHSHPRNYEKRKIIRETWGRTIPNVNVLFMTGLVKNTSQYLLEKENREHGDVVQGSFDDDYRNMTYKHVMVFKYAIYHCPQAKYILKTDDDIFVNMPLMMNFLNKDLSPYGGSKMLFCTLRKRSIAIRSWRSKWRVSFKEYSARTYPPYCPGWAILYSPDVVFDLYKEAQKSEYFWIDDVHITGTLAERVNIYHTDVDKLVLSEKDTSKIKKLFLYGYPNAKISEIQDLWNYVTKHSLHSSLLNEIR